jgi:hypothetical protein
MCPTNYLSSVDVLKENYLSTNSNASTDPKSPSITEINAH